ncbi:putative Amidohydrolase-related domain-containing protein [Seiridium unicorne]|uniref:Amidohydrolase-related domain-containing protein n=1 Tax=Seiridium unicorne TaxID=138068 RepID=A0ABR2UGL4_9PEZI
MTVLKSGPDAISIAADAGVTICYGSDLLTGTHKFQRREFTLRSQVQTPLEILRSATTNCARMLRMEDKIGQVKEGFLADLIILRTNPLDDITTLDDKDNLLAVVKDGHVSFSTLPELGDTTERNTW